MADFDSVSLLVFELPSRIRSKMAALNGPPVPSFPFRRDNSIASVTISSSVMYRLVYFRSGRGRGPGKEGYGYSIIQRRRRGRTLLLLRLRFVVNNGNNGKSSGNGDDDVGHDECNGGG